MINDISLKTMSDLSIHVEAPRYQQTHLPVWYSTSQEVYGTAGKFYDF